MATCRQYARTTPPSAHHHPALPRPTLPFSLPSPATRYWPATRGGLEELSAREPQEAATALAMCCAAALDGTATTSRDGSPTLSPTRGRRGCCRLFALSRGHHLLIVVQVVHILKSDSRLADNGLPIDIQRLRCRCLYQAWHFSDPIEYIGKKTILRRGLA